MNRQWICKAPCVPYFLSSPPASTCDVQDRSWETRVMQRRNRRQHRCTLLKLQPLPCLYSRLAKHWGQRFVPPDGGREVQKEREQLPYILLKAKFKNYKMNSCIQQHLLSAYNARSYSEHLVKTCNVPGTRFPPWGPEVWWAFGSELNGLCCLQAAFWGPEAWPHSWTLARTFWASNLSETFGCEIHPPEAPGLATHRGHTREPQCLKGLTYQRRGHTEFLAVDL